MRFTVVIGLAVLVGSAASPLAGQRVAAAPVPPASCTEPFAQARTPSPGSGGDDLRGAAASGPGDEWAVGRRSTSEGYQNLILHNGGHGWSEIPPPDPVSTFSVLTSVSASGPADAWAAGSYETGNPDKPFAPETLHWDGSSWTLVPFPELPNELDSDVGPGIVDISPTDAWLVGAQFATAPARSIIAHWNGTAWSLVTHPGVPALSAVAADGPHDVWAVGTGAGPSFPAVIEHYDGSKWTVSATLPGISLSAVTSIGPAAAWAVGTSSDGNATATVKWNGSAWNVVPSPNLGSEDSLSGVSGVAGGGVWAVGNWVDFSTGLGYSQPMAMHWDGKAWTAASAIGVGPSVGFTGTFQGVVAVSSFRVLAVGYAPGQAASLVAKLCASYVRDAGFDPPSAEVTGPGASAYWAVPASATSSHRLADGTGFGLFDSGVKAPGSSYAFAFPASGTYVVTDRSDGAQQKVAVPILTVPASNPRPALWLASGPPPAGAVYEIEDIPPGGTKFVHFRSTTSTTQKLHSGLPAGTYKFRSRIRNPTSGLATGWSPTITITLTG